MGIVKELSGCCNFFAGERRKLHFRKVSVSAPAGIEISSQKSSIVRTETMTHIDPWLALGVLLSTAATDAVYVLFNAAVSSRRRVPAATWSSIWYLLSAFAVISYTKNWVYVGFAATGSWIGAYISMTLLHRPKGASGPTAG
jgi:hypothetical protein